MINNINPKVRGIILEDLMQELFPGISNWFGQYISSKVLEPIVLVPYIKQREIAYIERYLTTGLNLCDIDNELLIIIPDYLISTIERISFRNIKLPQEIPYRFTEFLKQNQTAIELIAYIHMSNLLTK